MTFNATKWVGQMRKEDPGVEENMIDGVLRWQGASPQTTNEALKQASAVGPYLVAAMLRREAMKPGEDPVQAMNRLLDVNDCFGDVYDDLTEMRNKEDRLTKIRGAKHKKSAS